MLASVALNTTALCMHFYVPFGAHPRTVGSGAVEVIVRPGDPLCVELYGATYDDPASPSPSTGTAVTSSKRKAWSLLTPWPFTPHALTCAPAHMAVGWLARRSQAGRRRSPTLLPR
jgi:hypothetical protein